MTSRIEFLTIDETYPYAGRNNDSQGFRDNFTIIKDSLSTANAEMTDLQKNAARTDQDNDFANNTVERVNLKAFSQLYKPEETKISDAEGNKEIVVSEGHYQTFIVGDQENGSVTLSLTGWPTDENYASVIVELVTPAEYANEYSVMIGSDGGSEIYREPSTAWAPESTDRMLEIRTGRPPVTPEDPENPPEPFTGKYVQVFKFWTYNGGGTVFAKHLGNYDTDPDAPVGDVAIYLGNLRDTAVRGAKNGDLLIYNTDNRMWEASKVGEYFSGDIDGPPSENGDRGVTILDHNARTITADLFGDANSNIVTSNQVKLRAFANNSARDQEVQLPVGGEMVFVTDVDGAPELQGHDGDKWVNMLGGGGGGSLEVIEVPGTFSILSQDVNKFFRVTNPNPVDVIIKAENTDTIKVGESFSVIQAGEGAVSILPDTGVIVNSVDGALTTRTRYSAMTMVKVNVNEWDLFGDLKSFGFLCAVPWDNLGNEQYADKQVIIGNGLASDGFEPAIEVTRPLLGFGGGDDGPILALNFGQEGFTDFGQGFIRPSPAGGDFFSDWYFYDGMSDIPPGEVPAGTSPSSAFTTTSGAELFVSGLYPGGERPSYWTTGETFAPGSVVIYFAVSAAVPVGPGPKSVPTLLEAGDGPDIVFTLNARPANDFSPWTEPVSVATQTVRVAESDVINSDTIPGEEVVNLVQFENPGWFNSFTVQMPRGVGVVIQDIRLCKDGVLQAWPLEWPVSRQQEEA